MNNEDKKAAFLKKAQENKANFDLHKKLIFETIEPLQEHLGKESIKHFYDTGKVTGGFLLALIEYAERYADTKVKNISSNSMLADEVCEHELFQPSKDSPMLMCKKCHKTNYEIMGKFDRKDLDDGEILPLANFFR